MRVSRFAACAVAVALCLPLIAGAAPAAPRPAAAMMAPVKAAANALISGKASDFVPNFEADADTSIVDEFAPYHFSGSKAASTYFAAFLAFTKSAKMTNLSAKINDVTGFDVHGDTAYLSVNMNFDGKMNGKPFHEVGIWAITLKKSGAKWLIDSAAWGTVSMHM